MPKPRPVANMLCSNGEDALSPIDKNSTHTTILSPAKVIARMHTATPSRTQALARNMNGRQLAAQRRLGRTCHWRRSQNHRQSSSNCARVETNRKKQQAPGSSVTGHRTAGHTWSKHHAWSPSRCAATAGTRRVRPKIRHPHANSLTGERDRTHAKQHRHGQKHVHANGKADNTLCSDCENA